MRITKIIATAGLCVSVVLGAAGVAAAEPAPAERPAVEVNGIDHGVGYRVAVSADNRAAVGTIATGRFLATWDAQSIAVTDDSGQTIANLPLRYDIAGKRVELAPVIDEAGRRLTLTPAGETAAPLRDIDAQRRLFDLVQANLPAVATGAAIGAAVGFVLGFPAGLFILDFITVPITTVLGGLIGAAAGLYASGGQPALDSALESVNGLIAAAVEAPR
ncbi:hypothetical protein NDR87_24385 [Nocardia sp. CDC159]|uniref:DUF8020 domain-containing protein n=1 Tax=Nocardia pulmonis TaxID=2951408 RepID=A0A9X2E7J5_9NOCA|nr:MULTISPECIES: hypothetical protein [Nocardia]MCM6775040.1 hypothetical protein [Nocardia pulmonis]MCM6789510.1 hypothetical protein [Nocardia sp. CDC159]